MTWFNVFNELSLCEIQFRSRWLYQKKKKKILKSSIYEIHLKTLKN